jgi:hypothetical protein
MTRLQEVPHRGGGGQLIAQQGCQRGISSKGLQILAAIPTGCPQRDQRFDELGGQLSPLPLFDPNLVSDHLGCAEAAKQLDYQRHARSHA